MNYSNEQTQKPTARFPRLRLRSWWGPQKTEPRGSTSRYQASARAVWPNIQQLTLPQFQEQMVGLLRGKIAGSTLVLYASSLRVLSRVVGDIPVASLRAYHIELFMARRLEEVSGVRVNIEFRALRALLNRAASYGMVPENPMAGLRQVRLPRREPRALSRKEFARLLSVINRREFRALAIFAVCTAMRAGEIASLRWQGCSLESPGGERPQRTPPTIGESFRQHAGETLHASHTLCPVQEICPSRSTP